jgi:hypothetical protein
VTWVDVELVAVALAAMVSATTLSFSAGARARRPGVPYRPPVLEGEAAAEA